MQHPLRVPVLVVVLLAALGSLPGRAAAQEVQVPLDARGRVETVDARLAASLGLWTAEHPGFREARLFRGPDGYVLEVTSERGGRTVRERLPLSAVEAEALRARVAAGLDAGPRPEGGDPGARALLLSGTTLMGLGFYGWAVPVAFGADAEGAASLYMLTSAGSFFVPWLLTGEEGVTWGEANAALYGASRGPVHGWMLAELVGGAGDDLDDDANAGAAVLVGTVEAAAGLALARRSGLDAGHVHLMGVGGDLGMAYGFGTAVLLDAEDGRDGERVAAGLALAGGAAGLALGHGVASRGDFTWGDAEALRATALVGALSGGALASLADVEDERLGAATVMTASAAGLWLGGRMVGERDLSVADGILLDLGSVAGGALGLGLAYLADPGVDNEGLYATAAALGAAAGFAGTYGAIRPGSGALAVGDDAGRWSVRVSPEALAAGALLGGGEAGRGVGAPLAAVNVRF